MVFSFLSVISSSSKQIKFVPQAATLLPKSERTESTPDTIAAESITLLLSHKQTQTGSLSFYLTHRITAPKQLIRRQVRCVPLQMCGGAATEAGLLGGAANVFNIDELAVRRCANSGHYFNGWRRFRAENDRHVSIDNKFAAYRLLFLHNSLFLVEKYIIEALRFLWNSLKLDGRRAHGRRLAPAFVGESV